jgi:glycosyltransferase involved in cell wall biosynthesis
MKKNLVVIDSNASEADDFLKALRQTTGEEWELLVADARVNRKKALANVRRYFKYFTVPFQLFLNRRQYDKIVAWQQFYGLVFAFWCRLFGVKKENSLVVMTFIYKSKKGLRGFLYQKFIAYILRSPYVDRYTCTSSNECRLYGARFQVPVQKFAFVPWGIIDFNKLTEEPAVPQTPYFISPGRSNRDYDFLADSVGGSAFSVKIVCDDYRPAKELPGNVEVYDDVHGLAFYQMVKNSFAVIIPIADGSISAGQTILIQALLFGKPLIITESLGLTADYIENEKNGLIIPKTKEALLHAMTRLTEDPELYARLARSGRECYLKQYSTFSLGTNVGNVVLACKQ